MQVIINIDVPDVARAELFYEEALGLQKVRRLFGGKLAEMTLDGQVFHILPKADGTAASAAGPARSYVRHWTPLHLDFVVPDLDAAVHRAVQAGGTLERPITAHVWGRIAGFADPFGHGFCLIELTDEGYGAVAS